MKGFPQTTCPVDWMVDVCTSQCPQFVYDRPLPASTSSTGPIQVGVDIFALSASLPGWSPGWSPGWLNPPWHLIPHVLKLVLNCLVYSFTGLLRGGPPSGSHHGVQALWASVPQGRSREEVDSATTLGRIVVCPSCLPTCRPMVVPRIRFSPLEPPSPP